MESERESHENDINRCEYIETKERPIEIDLHSHKGEIEGRPKNSSTIYTKTHKGITQSAATDKERSVWDRSNKHFEVFENILSLTSH